MNLSITRLLRGIRATRSNEQVQTDDISVEEALPSVEEAALFVDNVLKIKSSNSHERLLFAVLCRHLKSRIASYPPTYAGELLKAWALADDMPTNVESARNGIRIQSNGGIVEFFRVWAIHSHADSVVQCCARRGSDNQLVESLHAFGYGLPEYFTAGSNDPRHDINTTIFNRRISFSWSVPYEVRRELHQSGFLQSLFELPATFWSEYIFGAQFQSVYLGSDRLSEYEINLAKYGKLNQWEPVERRFGFTGGGETSPESDELDLPEWGEPIKPDPDND